MQADQTSWNRGGDMEQSQQSWDNDGYASNHLFPDNPQFNFDDQMFGTEAGAHFSHFDWPMTDNNDYTQPPQSRVAQIPNNTHWMQQPQQQTQNLAPPLADLNGHRSLSHSPDPSAQNIWHHYTAPQQSIQYWPQPAQQFDPALLTPHHHPYTQQNFNGSISGHDASHHATIAPQALQQQPQQQPQRPTFLPNPYETPAFASSNSHQPQLQPATPQPIEPVRRNVVDQTALAASIPKGKASGNFTVIDVDELSKSTNSEPMNSFVHVGKEPLEWNVSRAALPTYAPRKSLNDLRRMAETDPTLRARLGKKMAKKVIAPPKLPGSTASPQAGERIKYEGESSSNAESSSDEDDNSSYTSDSDSEEAAPLPSTRPINPKEAVEYDTTKALWRSKHKSVSHDSVKKGVVDFWDVVKTIRDRWKADSAALTEAMEKNPKDLPLMESRVSDQRDMIEVAFRTALKQGHRGVVEILGSNASLVFLCYQFLLDRAKNDDYNGPMAKTILETLSTFTTMDEGVLEKTHLVKVLPRFTKKGDAKIQEYVKLINANAAKVTKQKADSEEQTSKKPSAPTVAATTEKSATGSPLSKRAIPEPVAGVKRPATTSGDAGPAKKVAASLPSTSSPVPPAARPNGAIKKILPPTGKLTANVAAAKPKPAPAKVVPAKPSGFFSSLQSATKKPGTSISGKAALNGGIAGARAKAQDKSSATAVPAPISTAPKSTFSFADTMAALSKPKEEKPTPQDEKEQPQESPEEKVKRLRKESRRHLHVSFKPMPELEEIREFVHDPEEELGHDSSQMRDVADVGGEGRMFKQHHQMMDIDDEDEIAEQEEHLIDFAPPQLVDFSDVDPEERSKNYAPYGGGDTQPDSPERSAREVHEANTLIVIYTSPDDIPPNPAEPAEPHSGEDLGPAKDFGMPEEKYLARAKAKTSARTQQRAPTTAAASNAAAPAFDFAKFASYTNNPSAQLSMASLQQQPQQQQQQQQAQPQAPSQETLSSILAALRNNAATQNQPAQQQAPAPNPYGFPPQMDGSAYAPSQMQQSPQQQQQPTAPPAGQPDLAAILATLRGQAPAASGPAPTGYGAPHHHQQGGAGPMNEDDGGRGKRQHPFWRTKTCMYWQQGKCQKGDACSYKHEE